MGVRLKTLVKYARRHRFPSEGQRGREALPLLHAGNTNRPVRQRARAAGRFTPDETRDVFFKIQASMGSQDVNADVHEQPDGQDHMAVETPQPKSGWG